MRSGRSCVAASGRRGKYAHVAHELQDVLQAAIGGSSLDAISASALSLRSGLSPEEIYGLAHADRRVPFLVTSVRRIVEAAGFNFQVARPFAA